MHRLLLPGLLLMVLLAGCDLREWLTVLTEPQVEEVDTALVERGIEVYRVNYCGSCHTLTAANTRGTFGPAHDAAGRHATDYITRADYSGAATTAADYIRESILEPAAWYTPGYETTNHHMPAFTHLPEADIEAMVYMLVQQQGAGDQAP